MSLQLDHIFIITKPDAPVASQLLALGLNEGNSNVHPGQGTSNRRLFFDNFTIELLFISDAHEAANGAGKQLGLLQRSEDEAACPFGLVTRVLDTASNPDFPAWQYFPDYFPKPMCFFVGENSTLMTEPLCICMPPSLPKTNGVAEQYANPGWQFTALTIRSPVSTPSQTLKEFAAIKNVNLELGKPHLMTVQFNDGAAGQSTNLMPELPLQIEW